MVLTAAHCMWKEKLEYGEMYKDVKVYVGTNIDRTSLLFNINKHGRKVRAKEICIHPDFNHTGDPSQLVKHGIKAELL